MPTASDRAKNILLANVIPDMDINGMAIIINDSGGNRFT